MSVKQLLISIGLPVFNGGEHFSQTLDALMAQDYENFELIISDNASTDETKGICRHYEAKDSRIHYFRNEINVGAAKNFNRVFELSNGPYFMWAGDHDLWHPTFISKEIELLESEPSVVLAYSRTMTIDTDGNPMELAPDRIDTRGMPRLTRYLYLIENLEWCNMIHGVIRRQALKQTMLFSNIFSPDLLLLAELSLQGAFAQLPETLFYRRLTRPSEDGKDAERWKNRALDTLDPATSSERSKMAVADLFREVRNAHLRMLFSSRLPPTQKLLAAWETIKCHKSRFGVAWPGGPLVEKLMESRVANHLSYRLAVRRQINLVDPH
jgi:glycosyltransferase involved in cell wall biosynthesis